MAGPLIMLLIIIGIFLYFMYVPYEWQSRHFGISLTAMIATVVLGFYVMLRDLMENARGAKDAIVDIIRKKPHEKEPSSVHLYNFRKNIVLLVICLATFGYWYYEGIDLSERDSWFSLVFIGLVILMLIVEIHVRHRLYRQMLGEEQEGTAGAAGMDAE